MPNQIRQLKSKIIYSSIESPVFSNLWLQKLRDLPINIQNYCLKFHQIIDQKRRVLGYTLLSALLSEQNLKPQELNELIFNQFKKPALKNISNIHFNLSYSGELVLAAISENEIGIDIEKINSELSLSHYEKTFDPKIWIAINQDKQPINSFYNYWTQLEATIKAEGSGFYSDTQKIQFKNDHLVLNNKSFYIYQLDIDKNYIAHLASSQQIAFTAQNLIL